MMGIVIFTWFFFGGGAIPLQLFDLDTISMTFDVFEFPAITIVFYCNGPKLKNAKSLKNANQKVKNL